MGSHSYKQRSNPAGIPVCTSVLTVKPTREFSAGSSFCGLVNTRDPVRVGGQGAATGTPHLQISVYSPLLGKGLWELKAVVNQCQSVLLVAKGNSFARRERTRLSHEPGWCTSLISRFSSRSATALQVCKKYKTPNADEILTAQQHPQKRQFNLKKNLRRDLFSG